MLREGQRKPDGNFLNIARGTTGQRAVGVAGQLSERTKIFFMR